MQPFISKIVNGKAIGLTNIQEDNPTPPTPSREDTPDWQVEFDRRFYYGASHGRLVDIVEIREFIKNLLSSRLTEIEGKIEASKEKITDKKCGHPHYDWPDERAKGINQGLGKALRIIKEARER